MTAAERLELVTQNRRQIFRIVDPEFADLRVLIKASEEEIEATCLDISATGIGLLVPQRFFEMATPGAIIEYSIFFGPLSPVRGTALVASCIETAIHEGNGPLLRLGLRFTEAQGHESVSKKANGRRSQRHFVPLPLRPLCVCQDPLWLGDDVAIQVIDFSVYGLSGIVSAKKTVFAEGLRTVFRFGFDYLGIFEVPVRVIYANPTDDAVTFRIGCEFVRRPKDFVTAVETFFSLYLLQQPESSRQGWLRKMMIPAGHVLCDQKQIEEARESSAGILRGVPSSPKSEESAIYACLAERQDETTDPFFRMDIITPEHPRKNNESEQSEIAKPDLWLRSMVLPLDEIHTTGSEDLSRVISTFFYLATTKRVEQVLLKHGTASSQVWTPDHFYKAGLRHLPQSSDGYLTYRVADLLAGKNISFGLWMASFFPMSRFYTVLSPLFSRLTLTRRAILFIGYLLQGRHSAYVVRKEVPLAKDEYQS